MDLGQKKKEKYILTRRFFISVLTVLLATVFVLSLSCQKKSGSDYPLFPSETLTPGGASETVVTQTPSTTWEREPQTSLSPDITRGPELSVSPIPETPTDPLDPANYPLTPELEAELKNLLDAYGYSIEGIFNIIEKPKRGYPRFYYDYDDKLYVLPGYYELASYILKEGHGVCYHYAALTCYLLRTAGYNACVIYGYRPADNALHYWTMVETPKGWYHFDPLHHQMLLTDEQKNSDKYTGGNGIVWQQGVWPRTPEEFY